MMGAYVSQYCVENHEIAINQTMLTFNIAFVDVLLCFINGTTQGARDQTLPGRHDPERASQVVTEI